MKGQPRPANGLEVQLLAEGATITETKLWIPPRLDRRNSDRRQCLIFFIPGNPGLFRYYLSFLVTLRELLRYIEDENEMVFSFVAMNLRGFSESDHTPFGKDGSKPFSLAAQIDFFDHQVRQAMVQKGDSKGQETGYPDDVILMGHSVGSYIALEVFHRHLDKVEPRDAGNANLKAGIMLFPTVTHIAKSPNGRCLELVRRIPWICEHGYKLPKLLLDIIPMWFLYMILLRVMGFTPDAAQTTTSWLKSRDGLWQTFHLGKDEMVTIREEKWKDELWEISEDEDVAGNDRPKFCFYFGKKDEWVADESRQEFIQKRDEHAARDGPRHKRGRTRVAMDEANTPHAFCIQHSELVAQKVKAFIDEIMVPAARNKPS